MKTDFSEYQLSEYEKYLRMKGNTKDLRLDHFLNYARFFPEEKKFYVIVDSYNEEICVWEDILADEKRKGFDASEDDPEFEDMRREGLAQNKKDFDALAKRYRIDRSVFDGRAQGLYQFYPGKKEAPLNNVLSGASVEMYYGEGILDFIYADFGPAFQSAVQVPLFFQKLASQLGENRRPQEKPEPTKVYDRNQLALDEYYAYQETMQEVKDIAYCSLYTAVCPPVFSQFANSIEALKRYYDYLIFLQTEYLEMLEFCFDEEFYPEVLGGLHPSERYAMYRGIQSWPASSVREERFSLASPMQMQGKKIPYGMPMDEFVARVNEKPPVTEQHREFAQRYGMKLDSLMTQLRFPRFVNIEYEFHTTADILELEFTKMLEQDVRFRKCKRCGRYFIMKGNYDTKYCDRIMPGQTQSCQTLAAQENYRKKVADDAALPIYSKYYKRYAARVRAGKITDDDLRKWKYKAMTKRDECSNGQITPEELTEWMEHSFPNRRKKKTI